MEWTQEQDDAIEYRDSSAIVSAAAGSGKTAVLVEHVIRLICDEENPVMADKLALVTFTEKAAAEMRERLKNALSAKTVEEPENAFLSEQLIRLQDASVSTISSFCINLLRENVHLLPLESGFSIVAEAEAEILRKTAVDSAMQRFYAEFPSEKYELLYDWFGKTDRTTDSGISEMIQNFQKLLVNTPNRDKWLDNQLFVYSHIDDEKDRFYIIFNRIIHELIAEALAVAEDNISEANCLNDKFIAVAKADFAVFDSLNRIPDYFDKNNFSSIKTLVESRFANTPAFKGDGDPTKFKFNRDLLKKKSAGKSYIERIAQLVSYAASFLEDTRTQAPVLQIIAELVGIFNDEYSALKIERNCIDFSDAENMLLDILREKDGTRSQTARKIASRYDYIIVDEFQDSNDIQFEIFRLISDDEKNLFLVGDIKQSIYAFRGANPIVFANVLKNPIYKPLYLTKNFRSSSSVINAVNSVFSGLMTEENTGCDYDEKARLNYAGGYDKSTPYPAELCLLDSKEDGQRKYSSRIIEEQAVYTAQRIAEMYGGSFVVTEKGGNQRKCRYGDFAVMFRSDGGGNMQKALKSAFDELGIPSVAKEEKDIFSVNSVNTILDLLRTVDNPYNDTALLNVLMSPLYMFTPQELAEYTLGSRKKNAENERGNDRYLYSCVESAARSGNPHALSFIRDIAKLRNKSRSGSVEDLVRCIYTDSDFVSLVTSESGGETKAANLSLMLEHIRSFEQAHSADASNSLFDFLAYIDVLYSHGNLTQAKSASDSENAVQILTVHGAKGLEFPVCFLLRAETEILKSNNDFAVFQPAGVGMKIVNKETMYSGNTMLRYHYARMETQKALAEEMRILYVALTRAKEKLIIVASSPDRETDELKSDSFLKWIAQSKGAKEKTIQIRDVRITEDGAPSYYQTELNESAADGNIVSDRINFVYPYELLTKIPAKLTATQIGVDGSVLEETQDEPTVFPRNPSFLKKTGLTGKKRGDAYHKVMELLDFSDADIRKQLNSFYESGKLSDEEYSCVSPSDIEGFFRSELGKRAAKSARVEKEFPIFTEIELSVLGIKADFGEEKPFVQGIADMFFYEDEDIVLLDYKTNMNTTAEKLCAEYHGQLELYKKAIEEMTGAHVKECYLYSFFLGAEVLVFDGKRR